MAWHRTGDKLLPEPMMTHGDLMMSYHMSSFVHFYKHGLTLISSWLNNHIQYKVWEEIIYPSWDKRQSMLVQ